MDGYSIARAGANDGCHNAQAPSHALRKYSNGGARKYDLARSFLGITVTYVQNDSPTELYFRRGGSVPPHVLLSRCGTRQGCPLGAQLYALGQHPLLDRLQRLLGSRGVVLAYAQP